MSVNKVILVGRLGQDPEVKQLSPDSTVATFTLATSETWVDRTGQRQERTQWHRVVVWGRLAQLCGQYLQKGRQVYVEGRLQTRQWEDAQGQKRQTTEVVAQVVQFLDRPGTEKSQASEPLADSVTSFNDFKDDFKEPDFSTLEDELPF